jgi:RimJ/RimL family protein N-acetyltransferase
MTYTPRLYTPRLCLRPLALEDASRVEQLAGDVRVAGMTASIPHPYPAGAAATWIRTLGPLAAEGRSFAFAVTLTGTRTPGREGDPGDTGHLVGVVGLVMDGDPEQQRGELGYWIGTPYWNKGFATEAARAVVDFGFARRHLHRLAAGHFAVNPASGRVMEKLGMTREGVLRSHLCRFGEFHDVVCYALLRDEWEERYLHRTRRYVEKPQENPQEVALAV